MTRSYYAEPAVTSISVPFALKGRLRELTVESGLDRTVEHTTYKLWDLVGRVRSRMESTRNGQCRRPSLNSAFSCLWSITSVSQFDEFGNPTVAVSGDSDGTTLVTNNDTTRTVTVYDNFVEPYRRIGLVHEQSVYGYRENIQGQPAADVSLSRVTNTYDSAGHLKQSARAGVTPSDYPASLRVPPDAVVTYVYDAYGLTRRVTGNAEHPLDLQIEYREPFLHPAVRAVSVTRYRDGQPRDAVTLREAYNHDLRTGAVMQRVDFNGKEHRDNFDSFGRAVAQFATDGSKLATHQYQDTYPVKVTSEIFTEPTRSYRREEYRDASGRSLALFERVVQAASGGRGGGAGGANAARWIRRQWIQYDAFGRPWGSYAPAMVVDSTDRLPAAETPMTITTFDGLDRVVAIRKPGDRVFRFRFEPHAIVESNPRGNTVERTVNWRGNLTRLAFFDASGAAVGSYEYRYDGTGRLIAVIDPDGVIRRVERDTGGRAARMTLPYRQGATPRIFTVRYDVTDDVIEVVTSEGRNLRITRDELGRAVRFDATVGAATSTDTVDYDDEQALAMGRAWKVSNGSGATVTTYDGEGYPKSMSYTPSRTFFGAQTGLAPEYLAQFTRSPAGFINGVAFGQKRLNGTTQRLGTLAYIRDALGRATQVDSVDDTGRVSLAKNTLYDARDRMEQVSFNNGLNGRWTFDAVTDQLSAITYVAQVNQHEFHRVAYAYDANDNPRVETRTFKGQPESQKEHEFDAMDRLSVSRVRHPSDSQVLRYGYSAGGNMLAAGDEVYHYDRPELAQAVSSFTVGGSETRSIDYDRDGQVTHDHHALSDGTVDRTIGYGPMGWPREIATRVDDAQGHTTRTTTTILTDASGRRLVRRTKADEAQAKPSHVIVFAGMAEIRPEEQTLLMRVRIGNMTTVEEARSLTDGTRRLNRSQYLLLDIRDSVLATTALDNASGQRRAAEYDPWGKTILLPNAAPPEHGFLGVEKDLDSGYSQLGPRLYDPTLRRFLSPDPLVLRSPEMAVRTGRQLSLYAYAANDPVGREDVSGLWSPEAHDKQLEHAFSGKLSEQDVAILQAASRSFDEGTQSGKASYMHSMAEQGQTPADAIKERDRFIERQLSYAKDLAQKGERDKALQAMGIALHPIMDSTSPEHVDQAGNPKVWAGYMRTGHGHSPTEGIGNETVKDITPEVYSTLDKKLNDALGKVFGDTKKSTEDAAVKEKEKRENVEKKK